MSRAEGGGGTRIGDAKNKPGFTFFSAANYRASETEEREKKFFFCSWVWEAGRAEGGSSWSRLPTLSPAEFGAQKASKQAK